MKTNIHTIIFGAAYVFLTAAALTLAVSCQKDEDCRDLTFTLVADDAPDSGKAYVEGRYICWHNGDVLKINNVDKTISVTTPSENNVTASITGVAYNGNGYVAAFPSSNVKEMGDGNTGAVIIGVPNTQVYDSAENASGEMVQVVPMPMVGRCAAGSSTLNFKNAASLVKVHITDASEKNLKLYQIILSTSDNAYLSGFGTLDETGKLVVNSCADSMVTLDCSRRTLPIGDGDDYYLVVAPFTGKHLMVRVLAVDGDGKKYIFTKVSPNTQSVGRNQIGGISISLSNNGVTQDFWGNGTSDKPYLITSYADLTTFYGHLGTTEDDDWNKNTIYYLQTCDIDASESSWDNTDKHFYAHYDGGGHSINLSLSSKGGFVYKVFGAEFKNLTLTGSSASTTSSAGPIGVFTNYVSGGIAKFENCVNNIPIKGKGSVGGFIGHCGAATSLKKCINNAIVTGGVNTYIGGLIGALPSNVTLEDCTNEKAVSGAGRVGGMVGGYDNNGGPITIKGFAVNNGDITSSAPYVGGILGGSMVSFVVEATATVTNNGVIKCTNTSTANYNYNCCAGGIIGYCTNNNSDNGGCKILGRAINNNTVDAGTSVNNYVGGIAGKISPSVACTIYCAQNYGSIKGKIGVGGIIGYLSCANSLVKDCSNSGEITGLFDVGGIAGTGEGTGVTYCKDTNYCAVTASGNGENHGVGGIIGRYGNTPYTLDSCLNTANVTASNGNNYVYLGGLVGFNAGVLTVRNCGVSSTCTLSSKSCKWGVAGIAAGSNSLVIKNSYCNATITCTGTNYVVSGIATLKNAKDAGEITVENCYFGGSVSSFDNITAFGSMSCRYNSGTTSITDCYSVTNSHKGSYYKDATYIITKVNEGTEQTPNWIYKTGAEANVYLITALNNWQSSNTTFSKWTTKTKDGDNPVYSELPILSRETVDIPAKKRKR